MAIDPKYSDLIQADIDGEIDAADKADLEAFLAENDAGRTLHSELQALSQSLEAMDEVEPPAHLRNILLNLAPSKPVATTSPGFFGRLFAGPALGYASMFAAGVILAMALVNSGQISTSAFEDMTDLVGTMADPASMGETISSVTIDESEVAGMVTMRRNGAILILDFDLSSREPVQITASYSDQTIWFNGFAQLEHSGTSVAAESGAVTLVMNGKRRYAFFLNNPDRRPTRIEIRFVVHGELIHETFLEFGG